MPKMKKLEPFVPFDNPVIPEGVREKLGWGFIIADFVHGMGLLMLSPNPNYEQYNRCVNHLQILCEPYADDTYNKGKKDLLTKLSPRMKSPKDSIRKAAQADYYAGIKILLFELIKRLGLGLEQEGIEEIG